MKGKSTRRTTRGSIRHAVGRVLARVASLRSRLGGAAAHWTRRSYGEATRAVGDARRSLREKYQWYTRLYQWKYRRLSVVFAALLLVVGAGWYVIGTAGLVHALDIAPVTGTASVQNTGGSVEFSSSGANVTVANATRQFSGYAWSSDLGWIDFGVDASNPTGPVAADRAGMVYGTAKALSGGLLRFAGVGSTVTIGTGGVLSGHAWSDDLGWVDLTGVTIPAYNPDLLPPDNPTVAGVSAQSGGTALTSGNWYNFHTPYFSWNVPADNANGITPSGVAGYDVYFGTDANADPSTYQTTRDFAVSDLGSASGIYYLRIKTVDIAGNVSAASTVFTYRYDASAPSAAQYVSVAPSGYSRTNHFVFTWPVTGGEAAADTGGSGLAKYQYAVNGESVWHTIAGDSTTSSVTLDGIAVNGVNTFDVRAVDIAGSAGPSVRTNFYFNNTSPTAPRGLTVTPTSNTTNAFAFTWTTPPGEIAGYYYSINALPTASNVSYTTATSLPAGAYATQPGENVFYVVAVDNAGNYDLGSCTSISGNPTVDGCAKVSFTAATTAPGIPLSVEAADVSVKATSSWKLALSWENPASVGAGVAQYRIYRATSATGAFTQIASTAGLGYFDGGLNQAEYFYKIRACDSANNCGADSAVVSKLPTGKYTMPAELSGVPQVTVGTRKATVGWATDRGSDSKVQFGLQSGNYQPGETAYSAQTQSHSVALSGLEAGTTYYYRAKWTDEDGNTGVSRELTFTTLPAPSVNNVKVVRVALHSVTLQFTVRDTAQAVVSFGKTNALGGAKTVNTSRNESTYTVDLDDLADGQKYQYRIDTTDGDGYTYNGELHDFTTPPEPRISDVQFQPIEGEPTSTQKVTWRTNVPTTTWVTYGVNGTTGTDVLDPKLVTNHSVIVRDLKDNSSYFLQARSRDGDGNLATSDRQSFKTALDTRPPKISDVNIETSIKGTGADARGQIVVTWKTDEPSTGRVAYGQGTGAYVNTTIEDARLTLEHTAVVSDLRPSSVYHLQPLSSDGAGNQTKGDEQSAIIGRPTDNVMTIILNALYKVFGL